MYVQSRNALNTGTVPVALPLVEDQWFAIGWLYVRTAEPPSSALSPHALSVPIKVALKQYVDQCTTVWQETEIYKDAEIK